MKIKGKLFFLIFLLLAPFISRANMPPPATSGEIFSMIIFMFTVNTIIECIVIWILVSIFQSIKNSINKAKFIISVLIANFISWPLFAFSVFKVQDYFEDKIALLLLIVLEIAVIFFESIIIYYLNKNKESLNFSKIFLITFFVNLISALLGIALAPVWAPIMSNIL